MLYTLISTTSRNYTTAVTMSDNARSKFIQHVFRWGVGNSYVANSKNRYRPTHKERNTSVTIRADYFNINVKFNNCKLVYDDVNEQWEVLWYEYGKLNGKPFPVKKFGTEASKKESIAFASDLDKRLGDHVQSPESTDPGMLFDGKLQCWVSLSRINNRPAARAFSADYHGYNNAYNLARRFKE